MSDSISKNDNTKQFDYIIERNFYIKPEDGRYTLICRPTMVSESCRYCNTPAEKMRRNGTVNITYFEFLFKSYDDLYNEIWNRRNNKGNDVQSEDSNNFEL